MSDRVTEPSVPPTAWPDLTLAQWQGTRDALHLWTQIVGKVRLALAPMVNHWWQVPFYVSARGLTTSLMHAGPTGLEAEFDFIAQRLELRSSTGARRAIALEPQSVADFYAKVMAALRELRIPVRVLPRPVETAVAIPFPEDTKPRPYDPGAAQRFWLALLQGSRVLGVFRSRFQGKVSPVHFFWGAADLAVSRFSGRRAPRHPGGVPNCPDRIQQLAYSHEVSSCGFWPGGSDEGSFYSYAYPTPPDFAQSPIEPGTAYFDPGLGEFILPYADVRRSHDPDSTLLAFFQSTYDAAAELAGWDREALEV